MFKLIEKIVRRIIRPKYLKGIRKYDLVIFDDYFPNPVTGFRLTEFEYLLKKIPATKVILDPVSYPFWGFSMKDFDVHLQHFRQSHPAVSKSVRKNAYLNNINTRLFYFVFLNNGRRMIHHLQKNKVDFVFTLYPGGGFMLGDKDTEADLKKIMSSRYFKAVIVNQPVISEYLIAREFCSAEKILCIPGIPIPAEKLNFDATQRAYFPEKETLDICFLAGKNLPDGTDKGYDLFIDAATVLHPQYPFVHFHVIGGFQKTDIPVEHLDENIHFYGYQDTAMLPGILKKFDIILSPNRPGMLGAGSFDGFPLGSCVETSLAGGVIVATDEMKQNRDYTHAENIIVVRPELKEIVDRLEELIAQPSRIKDIGIAGMKKTQELYAPARQLEPRLELLQRFINANK